MFEPYKISDMIKALEAEKAKHGDLTILLACDSEGNTMSHVGELVQCHKGQEPIVESKPFQVEDDKIVIFPVNPVPINFFFPDKGGN